MIGRLKNLIAQKGFGFILGPDKVEYFFHKQDFNGHWDDLATDAQDKRTKIEMEFEPTHPDKGPRATNVRRRDWPNES